MSKITKRKYVEPDGEEEIVYTEQDNDEVEEQSGNTDEETVQEEQVADSEDESENEDLLIPLSYSRPVWNLEDGTYTGTILKFSESTYQNGNPCWYTEIQVRDPEVIFRAKIPYQLNIFQGLGMAVNSLPQKYVSNLIGKRIQFAIENYETSNKCFSNIIASKLLKKK